MDKVIVFKNRYVDSVSLMSASERVRLLTGVHTADVLMGTPANLELLRSGGAVVPDDVTASDLVAALSADDDTALEAAVKMLPEILERGGGVKRYGSLRSIDLKRDPFDLVQISLPGEHAAREARTALEMGLDVFIFSDNVSLEDERKLKEIGRDKNKLVMGSDCGVGFIGGVALAAGSIVAKGPVGIVAASGSGAQEVACLIERSGLGVTSIIGTGGRDLYPEIGGISMLAGMERLAADPKTKVIVLVSKLADRGVMERVLTAADKTSKPVVSVFLGADEELYNGHMVRAAISLEDAALQAVYAVTGVLPALPPEDEEIWHIIKQRVSKLSPVQKYFRGLYCGGTFTEENLVYIRRMLTDIPLYSNLKTKYAQKLPNLHESAGHTLLDLGAEDFTKDAPHPVFDPGIRLARLKKELSDPEVGAILMDFITGPGVHSDPISAFTDLCVNAGTYRGGEPVLFFANICGAKKDPQDIQAMERKLKEAGVIVTRSSRQSAFIAARLIELFEGRVRNE